MAFWLYLLALTRRPRALIAMGATAALLALAAFLVIPSTYLSSATLVLTTSPTNEASAAGDPNENPLINPLLHFEDGLNTALAIVVQQMNAPDALDPLALDPGTVVTVSDIGGTEFLGNKGPFLFVTAQSVSSADAARDAVVRTEQLARTILLERQRSLNAPESQLITPLIVVPPTTPRADFGTRTNGALAGLVAGALIGLGVVYLRDRRRGAVPTAAEAHAATNGTAQSLRSQVTERVTADNPPHSLLAHAANGWSGPYEGPAGRTDATPTDGRSAEPPPNLDATVALPRYVPPDPDWAATERLVVVERATETTNGQQWTNGAVADPPAEMSPADEPVTVDEPRVADAVEPVEPVEQPGASTDGDPVTLPDDTATAAEDSADAVDAVETSDDAVETSDDTAANAAETASDAVATSGPATEGDQATPAVGAGSDRANGADDGAPDLHADPVEPSTTAEPVTEEATALPPAAGGEPVTVRRRPDGTGRVGKRPRPRLAPPRTPSEEAATVSGNGAVDEVGSARADDGAARSG